MRRQSISAGGATAILLALAACGSAGEDEPAAGVDAKPAAALRAALLAANRDSAPFRIRDGGPEGVDVVAEWKIVDARWYEIFAKAGIERVFKVLMRLDEAKHEVRAVDQEWTVEWRAGVPTLLLAGSGFRGQKWEKSFGTAYAFRENGRYGEVYDYRFDTDELKAPLKKAVRAAGWRWTPVAFEKL